MATGDGLNVIELAKDPRQPTSPDVEGQCHSVEQQSLLKHQSSVEQQSSVKHQSSVKRLWLKIKTVVEQNVFKIFSLILLIYSFVAIGVSGFETARSVFGVAMFLCLCFVWSFLSGRWSQTVDQAVCTPVAAAFKRNRKIWKWVFLFCAAVAVALWLGLDTAKTPRKFISLGGLAVFIIISYALCVNKKKISWRPVIWGIALQMAFALIILRTSVGLQVFKFLGDQIVTFLKYADAGSEFVFGKSYQDHFIAFKVLPSLFFVSALVNVLYYWGIVQILITKFTWLMRYTLGTSGVETVVASASMIVNTSGSLLLIKPFLEDLTMSELHAVMTSGLSSISAAVIAVHVQVGLRPHHILMSTVISAPAALAISKLMWPETEKRESSTVERIHTVKVSEKNVLEAAARGAFDGIKIVAGVGASMLVFVSLLTMVNGIFSWLGAAVGFPQISFELLISYIFAPFAFLMGVDWEDCLLVGRIIGIKSFLSEVFAVITISKHLSINNTGFQTLSVRSEVIATYALAGFSNLLSVATLLGGIQALAPKRTADASKIAVRTVVAGSLACFMTATIAGFLWDESLEDVTILSATMSRNITSRNLTERLPVMPSVLSILLQINTTAAP